eukprot:jgi/Botrbrau1/17205/Bobra.0817s0003.3
MRRPYIFMDSLNGSEAIGEHILVLLQRKQRAIETEVFFFVLKSGLIAHFIKEHLVSLTLMSGPSMLPTFYSGDCVVLDHLAPVLKSIQPGDVVVSKGVTNPRYQVCKRVIAMEGDVVTVRFPTSLAGEVGVRQKSVKIPPGHVWLEGDNSVNSQDSRYYGPVPYALLVGRAWLQVGLST